MPTIARLTVFWPLGTHLFGRGENAEREVSFPTPDSDRNGRFYENLFQLVKPKSLEADAAMRDVATLFAWAATLAGFGVVRECD
jgi:hypothetical protein